MSAADTALKRIHTAAKQRAKADADKRAATAALRVYCMEAKQAGLSLTQIAREAGLSRQGVYDLLAEPPSA